MSGERHKKKFKRWRSRQPEKSKWLIDSVLNIIVPKIEEKGFTWIDGMNGLNIMTDDDPEEYIDPTYITLFREGDGFRDKISIGFSHRQKLHFTIGFVRITDEYIRNPTTALGSDSLRRYPSDDAAAKEFGFRWFPSLANEKSIEKLVYKVVKLLPQIYTRLETGKAGWNVAKF